MKIKTVLTILFLKCFSFSETLNVPENYSTIQLAINASSDFDTILVSPGFYEENINYNGKNIVVTSTYLLDQDSSAIAQTIIDGDQDGSVVIFESNENKISEIEFETYDVNLTPYNRKESTHIYSEELFTKQIISNLKGKKITEFNKYEKGN